MGPAELLAGDADALGLQAFTSSMVPSTMSPSKIARPSTLAYCSFLSLNVAPDTTAVPATGPELYSHERFSFDMVPPGGAGETLRIAGTPLRRTASRSRRTPTRVAHHSKFVRSAAIDRKMHADRGVSVCRRGRSRAAGEAAPHRFG